MLDVKFKTRLHSDLQVTFSACINSLRRLWIEEQISLPT
jgi:hypothetical protein